MTRFGLYSILLAWVLWSHVSEVGGAGGWQRPVEGWQALGGRETQAACQAWADAAAAQLPGTPIPGGVMDTSRGPIRRITYQCLPAGTDPRPRG